MYCMNVMRCDKDDNNTDIIYLCLIYFNYLLYYNSIITIF